MANAGEAMARRFWLRFPGYVRPACSHVLVNTAMLSHVRSDRWCTTKCKYTPIFAHGWCLLELADDADREDCILPDLGHKCIVVLELSPDLLILSTDAQG